MNKYKVFYREGKKLGIGDDWFLKISAETPEQAYRKFIQEVVVLGEIVYVEDDGFPVGLTEFNNHVEEAEKRVKEEKAQTGEHPQESADRENSTAQSNQRSEEMKKYNCHFTDEKGQRQIGELQNINANSPEEAADIFCSKSNDPKSHILVIWGFGNTQIVTNPNQEIEEEKEVIVAKESFNEQISEITEKQGLNKPESSTEKLLIKIIDLQQNQFDELKKLNFKLMMFWIFLVVLPLLGWLLTQ